MSTFLEAITEAPPGADCPVDPTHGPMVLGADYRRYCPVCLYVPCACDPE